MKHPIRTPTDLALVIRAVRKSVSVRQDDLAGAAGVSRQFAVDVEKGKPTAQVGKVMELLKELGIGLSVDIPQEAYDKLMWLQQTEGTRTRSRKKSEA